MCEDFISEEEMEFPEKESRCSDRYYNKKKHKRDAEKLAWYYYDRWYYPYCCPKDKYGRTCDLTSEDMVWVKRYYRGARKSKYLKRQSNKSVRNYSDEIQNGSSYKKLFNYWWELY